MQHRKLSGIILSIEPRGEFDRLICIFSHELGIVHVMAKGARRIASRRGFHLDLFNLVRMEIEECGTSALPVRYLREITTQQNFTGIKNNPEKFSAACLVASFLKRVLFESAPQKNLFALTKSVFESFDKNKAVGNTLLHYFLKATRTLGYMPNVVIKGKLRRILQDSLDRIDPQFNLNARRTLGIFSNFDSTRSN